MNSKFHRFFKIFAKKVPVPEEKIEHKDSATTQPAIPIQDQFISDQPIKGKAEDRFNRATYSSRIAETIANRADPSSIVIGLFGPWGDGKTSVLEMMQETLVTYPNNIVIRFNPWHFQSEELLLRGFFATVAESLGQSLPNMKEKAGELFSKYGSLLSIASVTVGGVVSISPGESIKGMGEAMSNVGLDDLRKRIEDMLDNAKKRLVILIDDIDRLDRVETHAIFKIVKLSASFRHTSYVLAFDDDVVSASLGERYGEGGANAGHAFLEKIIQVPLHLPPADQNSLRLIALEGVQNALSQSGIELTQSQVDAFLRHFDDALLSQIETPRRAKLYSNAIMFALPILKGEVNPVDLMLIEGLRILYPKLYIGIRDNPALFLYKERDRNNRESGMSLVDSLIERSTTSLTQEERKNVKSRLLEPLFPRIKNTTYGGEWDNIWGSEQKICSNEYFKRYFSYSVPFGDVPDSQIKVFYSSVSNLSGIEKRAFLEIFASHQSLPRVISRLRQLEKTLTQPEASSIITTFSQNGDLLPRERGMMIFVDTRAQAAMLIAGLLRQITAGHDRQAEAERVIQIANPIGFAMECVRWIRSSDDTPVERRVLTDDGDAQLKAILTTRIEETEAESNIFIDHPKDAPLLFRLWSDGTSITHVQEKLIGRFELAPEQLDLFLACHLGESWGMESGLPRPSDFDREQYNSVTRLIPAEYIATNLRLRYGAELDNPIHHAPDSMLLPRRIAHQFMSLHMHVLQEQRSTR